MATLRRASLRTLMPRREPADSAAQKQNGARDREEHDRDGGRAGGVAALDPEEDVDRCDLRLVGEVPRDEDERADLTDGACESEADAAEDPREDVGQHDTAEDGEIGRAERAPGLFHLRVELDQD